VTDPQVVAENGGTVTVSAAVLEQIVQRAAEQGDVRVRKPRRGLDVSIRDGRARVALELSVRYGAVLPDVAQQVQERVAESLRAMCGLEASVDVTIEELTD
jgi:uncharacterized alkaline shock family protein YloU